MEVHTQNLFGETVCRAKYDKKTYEKNVKTNNLCPSIFENDQLCAATVNFNSNY